MSTSSGCATKVEAMPARKPAIVSMSGWGSGVMLVIRLQASKAMCLRVCESLRPNKICLVCDTVYATTRHRIAHAMPQNLRETYLSRLSMAIPINHHLRVTYACRLSGMTTSAPKQPMMMPGGTRRCLPWSLRQRRYKSAETMSGRGRIGWGFPLLDKRRLGSASRVA